MGPPLHVSSLTSTCEFIHSRSFPLRYRESSSRLLDFDYNCVNSLLAGKMGEAAGKVGERAGKLTAHDRLDEDFYCTVYCELKRKGFAIEIPDNRQVYVSMA